MEAIIEFSESQGMAGYLNHSEYNEELYELKEQLKKAFWRIINSELTPRQREVIKLTAQGMTQTEIAKILHVNQSSITKSLNGNCDYKNGKRVYGGAKKKLRRIAANDQEINDILERIAEIHNSMTF